MDRLGGGVSRVGAPTSVDSLLWYAKFPPSEVGFHPEHHPTHFLMEEEKFFLSALFQGATVEVPTRRITRLPVKQVGVEIPNLTLSVWENCMSSCVITVHLVAALRGRTYFKTGDHSMLLREECVDICWRHVYNTKMALEDAMTATPALDVYHLRRGTKTGVCLTVLQFTVNGADLGDHEWRNALFLL